VVTTATDWAWSMGGYKVGQEVVEQLFKVNQTNISLSVPVNMIGSYLAIVRPIDIS